MNICLFSNFLLKITFLMIKENNDLLFHRVTLEFQAFITTCYQGMYAFSTELWDLQMELL
jgi:hypothetical protein